MKYSIILLACSCVYVAQAQKPKVKVKTPAIKTTVKPAANVLKGNTDSISYAMGVNVATYFKSKGIDVLNTAMVKKAFDDVLAGKPTILTIQQCDQVMQEKMQSLQERLQAAAKLKIDAEKAKGKQFIDEVKSRPGVTVLPNGLVYEVLKSGPADSPMPTLTDTVVAHYAGTLIDGVEFDNSYKRGAPLKITVMGVIRGWTEILQRMRKGDKWKVYIPSDLAYGDRGAGAAIPGGATLIFEMELIDINPR